MEQSARMNIIKERLRRKQAENASSRAKTAVPQANVVVSEEADNEFASILLSGNKTNKKQGKK
jgi:hypothetical protein